MNRYMSISQRDTHHFDIYNGVRRIFAVRGEPGKMYVRDERNNHDITSFSSVKDAIQWCFTEVFEKE